MRILFKNPVTKKIESAGKTNLTNSLDKKPLNIIIEFDKEKIIGLVEVKKLLSLYKEMLNQVKPEDTGNSIEGNLHFRLSNRIRNFDLTFIAALNLVKFSFEKITIRLFFDRLTKNSEEEVCFFRFGQFATASFLAYGHEIFSIERDHRPVNPNFFIKNLSGYLPFIYVNEDRFEKLFQKPFKDTWDQWWDNLESEVFAGLKNKSNQAEKIYQELRYHVIQNIDFEGDPGQNILNFYIIYLFNAVRKFHFIKKALKNQLRRPIFMNTGISIDEGASPLGIGLSREADQEYEDKVQYIFDQILEKPLAFVMLFSYFIEMFYNPLPGEKASYSEKIKTRVEFISNIFYFTDEIFYGVRELAKNIIEHSSNHRGVIMGRTLAREYLPHLKKEMQVGAYLETRPANESDFIDFIVMDDGTQGIIEQTIKNLDELKGEFNQFPDILEKFAMDIKNLETGNIILDDFFNPEEIKLKYQEIRSAMSVGLLIFSHLVLENNGYMMVSSPHGNNVPGMALFGKWKDRRAIKEIVPLGTFYNIIFPKTLKRPPAPRSETVPFEMPSGESAFITLLKQVSICDDRNKLNSFPEEDHDPADRVCFIDSQVEPGLNQEDIDKISAELKKCDNCNHRTNRKILSLDLNKVFKLDAGDLFRFLARIQLIKDIKSIIVHNVKEEIVSGIIDIFKIFRKMNRKIGSSNHFVLFYYLPTGQIKKYFSFFLAGESWEDMCWINEKIAKTSYTQPGLLKGQAVDRSNLSPQFKKNFCSNPLFTTEGHLLPFDVLISRSGLTLFERNVLANLLEPGMHPTSPSYTFNDAHMRLGSKIHLKDFFYSRRIFQNSFYSMRFAYMIYRYIQDNISEWIDINEKYTPLTILGYGLYSELVISNVTRFLQSMHTGWQINHAVIDDAEELRVLGKVERNVITVIPISSTLSTSHKIEMKVTKTYPGSRIIGNPINIMIVGNGQFHDIIDRTGIVVDPIVSHFWQYLDIDKKIITTRSPGKNDKFFLYLPSGWYLPHNCGLCFPGNPAEETVLFETDKVSVTPSLIFDLPLPRKPTQLAEEIHFGNPDTRDKKNREAVVLTQDMLLYGHIVRGNNHHLYYIETNDFLKKNETFLHKWLLKVKDKLKESPDIFDSKVILIAPTHFTNADFINRVNETVFNDAATLFHYDQDEDYIQNLKSFFGHDIHENAYVFFIDDAMCGGSTFEKLNNFVKYARSGDHSRGIDGAFVLINRLMQDKYSVLVKELGETGFFAFVDLEVPIMIDSERFCHLCSEKKKYEKMFSETLLDSLRVLVKAKIMKLEGKKYEERDKPVLDQYEDIEWKYIPADKCVFSNPLNQANYLKRLEYVHRLYRAFSDKKAKNKIELIFRDIKSLEDLCKEVKISYSSKLDVNEKVDLIKVLSNPYFVYHKEIRKYIFKIVIFEMERTIQALLDVRDRKLKKDDVDTYRYLKFLIKRAAALKANYIIRVEILKKIFSVYHMLQNRLKGEEKDKKGQNMFSLSLKEKQRFLENLHGFVDYYMMAAKEVVWFNEARSLKLEGTLTNMHTGRSSDEAFLLLTQSLLIENISIPYRFLKTLEPQISDISLSLSFTEQNYSSDAELLSRCVITYCQDDPYRSSPLLYFLGFKKGESIGENEPGEIKSFLEKNEIFMTKILPMIMLKAFFLHEKRKKREEKNRMKPEMDYILYCLCKILDIDTESGGALFVVKHMKEARSLVGANLFTIGHIGKNKDIDSFDWDNSFTSKVFAGYHPPFKSLPLTYVQILKIGEDLCTHYGERVKKEDISELAQMKDMKSFLFLRTADDDLDSTARGVIVLYDSKPALINPEILRYALIVRNDIFDFIEKNYENYSFRSYEEKIRQLKELEALNLVVAKITSAADLCEVYEVIEKIKDTFPNIDEMCLLTQKNNEYELIFRCAGQEASECNCENCKQQKLACIKQDGSYAPYYYCPDVERDPILKEMKRKGLKTSFIIPLVFEKELLGILDIGSQTRDAFSPFERNLLTSLGSQVAIAINNRIKQDKQGEIFKDISHSLSNYLTTMRLYTKRLIEGKVKDEAKKEEYLKILYGDVLAWINSVDEISSLANMEYWDISSITERVEIMGIIKNLAGKNKFLLEEKNLKLNITDRNDKVYVKANKQKLEEALQSIVINAIKFSDKNKKIDIRLLTDEDIVLIEIEDQGYGIHKDDLKRIFEKYERGRNAKAREIAGTGIGLAAAKSIIEKHSGKISVKSKLGKGSIFTIKLPIIYKEEKK
jgi:signal transduction histidine kinase